MQVLSIRISSDGQNDPNVAELKNDFGSAQWSRTGTGGYTGVFAVGGFNNDYPPTWYISDSQGNRYVVSQVNATTIFVSAYDNTGAEADNLSGAKVEIIIW